jgi:hypothetical protein
MNDTSSKFCIFSLKSVGSLVHWSPLWTFSPKSPGFKPQTGQKRRTKNQKLESNFSRIHTGFNNRNFGPEFSAWFWEIETSVFAKNRRNHARSFGWAETGKILEVSGEKNLLCICVTLRAHQTNEMFFSCFYQLILGSFYVNLTNWCHPRSRNSKLIFFVNSTSNSKKKSHITFFSKTSPFWFRPFWTLRLFLAKKGSNLQNGPQKCQDMRFCIQRNSYFM